MFICYNKLKTHSYVYRKRTGNNEFVSFNFYISCFLIMNRIVWVACFELFM